MARYSGWSIGVMTSLTVLGALAPAQEARIRTSLPPLLAGPPFRLPAHAGRRSTAGPGQ